MKIIEIIKISVKKQSRPPTLKDADWYDLYVLYRQVSRYETYGIRCLLTCVRKTRFMESSACLCPHIKLREVSQTQPHRAIPKNTADHQAA